LVPEIDRASVTDVDPRRFLLTTTTTTTTRFHFPLDLALHENQLLLGNLDKSD